MEQNTVDQDYRDAQRRVRRLRHFLQHLTTYFVMIAFLHIINLLTSDYYWAKWPALGWGLAVVLHGIRHARYFPFFDKEWEEKKIQQILEKKSADRGTSTHR
ncbi:2TM domain-containing protein [Sneathiella aquimaris]|uniref:2TM domain-containing protein n=1 Tax=Sneathiella aquimaris TaxID=2599305 RepID=UPI00146A7703|nr:2TM domain-containing protein [Sneathiella aquimaris]